MQLFNRFAIALLKRPKLQPVVQFVWYPPNANVQVGKDMEEKTDNFGTMSFSSLDGMYAEALRGQSAQLNSFIGQAD